MLTLLAHANEVHKSGLEELLHFAAPWYIAIPVTVLLAMVVGYLAWIVSGRNISTVLLIEATLLLIVGFLTMNISSVVSIVAITCGLLLAGGLVYVGLVGNKS